MEEIGMKNIFSILRIILGEKKTKKSWYFERGLYFLNIVSFFFN